MATEQLKITPSDDAGVTGYAIGLDTVSRAGSNATADSYATKIDAGNVDRYTLTGLTHGVTYYIGVSAYQAFADKATFSLVEAADEYSFVANNAVPCSIGFYA